VRRNPPRKRTPSKVGVTCVLEPRTPLCWYFPVHERIYRGGHVWHDQENQSWKGSSEKGQGRYNSWQAHLHQMVGMGTWIQDPIILNPRVMQNLAPTVTNPRHSGGRQISSVQGRTMSRRQRQWSELWTRSWRTWEGQQPRWSQWPLYQRCRHQRQWSYNRLYRSGMEQTLWSRLYVHVEIEKTQCKWWRRNQNLGNSINQWCPRGRVGCNGGSMNAEEANNADTTAALRAAQQR